MNNMNEQLMLSLNTAYRTLRHRSVRESLNQAGIPSASFTPIQKGIPMDRRKLSQLKEQYAVLQRENVIRELAAIVKSQAGSTATSSNQVSEKRLMSYAKLNPEGIAEAITKLERDGFLSRTRSRTDRREMMLSLTAKGWARADELKKIKDRQNEEFLKPLTAEEKATLIQLLEKLNIAEEMGFGV